MIQLLMEGLFAGALGSHGSFTRPAALPSHGDLAFGAVLKRHKSLFAHP